MASNSAAVKPVPPVKAIASMPRAGTPSSTGRPSKNADNAKEWWWSNRTPRSSQPKVTNEFKGWGNQTGVFKAESSYSRNFSLNGGFTSSGAHFWKSTEVDFPRVSHHKYGFEKRPESRPGTAMSVY